MKKKILIIFIILLIIAFGVYIIINKNMSNNNSTTPSTSDNSTINNSNDNNENTNDNNDNISKDINPRLIKYKCSYDSGWNEFNPKEAFGYYLGKYRQTITYTFDVLDNKYISNTNYINKYEFENIDGYAYFALQGNYESDLDEANLTKTYTSTNYIVGAYTQDENINDYIKSLSNNKYTCDLNNE